MTVETRSYPVVDTLIDMFCGWLAHAREVAEVCNLDSAEFEHLAQDIGVTGGELEALVRKGSHAADEWRRMLGALGIDQQALKFSQPLVMRDMQHACAMCGEKRRCNRDLAAGESAQHYREYCSNAELLDALQNGVH